MWQIKRVCTVLAISAVTVLAACGSNGGDEPVATYQGGEVTQQEFTEFKSMTQLLNPYYDQLVGMVPDFERKLLDQYMAMELLSAKADDKTVDEQTKQAEKDYEDLKSQYTAQLGEDAWGDQLDKLDLDEDAITNYFAQSNAALAWIRTQLKDEDVKAVYDEKTANHEFMNATVSHILIATEDASTKEELRTKEEALERAKEVKTKLEAGEDFAALAKEYSDDPGSKDNGGTYENAPVSNWTEGFKEAVIDLPIGQISDPVETVYGYHIIKVTERSEQTYEEVKDQVSSEAANDYFSTYMEKDLPDLVNEVNLPETDTDSADNNSEGTSSSDDSSDSSPDDSANANANS